MKKICVYCGSSSGKHSVYLESAVLLGEALVKNNIGLVYGGASIGLMGKLADTMIDHGAEVIGVIPHSLEGREIAHKGLSELKIVNDMHERKLTMAQLSEGFIALPGGYGTLEELFEALTWNQLDIHRKPCGLLNINGYYDHLCEFLGQTIEQGFIKPHHKDLLITDSDPQALIDKMLAAAIS